MDDKQLLESISVFLEEKGFKVEHLDRDLYIAQEDINLGLIVSVELEAVNHAHWIDNHNGTISCSYCHTWFNKDDRYSYMRHCPYCNIKMEESEE